MSGLISPVVSQPADISMSEKAQVNLSDKTSPVKGFEKPKFIEKRDDTNKGFSKKISSRVVHTF